MRDLSDNWPDGTPEPKKQLGNSAFVLLVVGSLVAVGGIAFLLGRSLDSPSQAQQNQFPGVPQAVPAPPLPIPPGIIEPGVVQPPPPFPTPEPIPPGVLPDALPQPPLPPDAVPPGALDFIDAPTLNDHWHSVYGVYSCNLIGEGDDKFLAPFQSNEDVTGIHSHGDGLIHVHPFFEEAAGPNAVMGLWFDEMNIDVDPEGIRVFNDFDPVAELIAGEECADGTGRARIVVLRWPFDFLALAQEPPAEIITDKFDDIRFFNDREVFLLAYVAEGTDLNTLPLPPQLRFDALQNVSSVLN